MHCKLLTLKQCLKELRNWISCILCLVAISFSTDLYEFIYIFFWRRLVFRLSYVLSVLFILSQPATLLKNRLWHRYFPVDFAKFFKTPFLLSTSGSCFCLFWIHFIFVDFLYNICAIVIYIGVLWFSSVKGAF